MKKLVLLILTIFGVYNVNAQRPFKPLSEFQQDTMAYMQYNYGSDNGEALKGKTIGEFLSGADVEYTTFELVYDKTHTKIIEIILYLQPYELIKARKRYIWIDGIRIFPDTDSLTRENMSAIFDEFYSENSTYYPLNARNLNFFKDLVITRHNRARFIVI